MEQNRAKKIKNYISTLAILGLYPLATFITIPGVDPVVWKEICASQVGRIFELFNYVLLGGK